MSSKKEPRRTTMTAGHGIIVAFKVTKTERDYLKKDGKFVATFYWYENKDGVKVATKTKPVGKRYKTKDLTIRSRYVTKQGYYYVYARSDPRILSVYTQGADKRIKAKHKFPNRKYPMFGDAGTKGL